MPFHVLVAHLSIFGEISNSSPWSIFKLFVFLSLSCRSSLNICILICKYLLPFSGLPFTKLIVFFGAQEILIWMKSYLSIFHFVAYGFGVRSKNPLPSLR